MFKSFLKRRRLILFLIDIIIISSVYIATISMVNSGLSSLVMSTDGILLNLLNFVACISVVRFITGIYSRIWRYANADTYLTLLVSDFISGIAIIIFDRFLPIFDIGIAGIVIVVMGEMVITVVSRLIYQQLHVASDKHLYNKSISGRQGKDVQDINIAIVGAGNIGATFSAELLRNPKFHYVPRCFVDIDANKVDNIIHGLPIFSPDDKLYSKLRSLNVTEVVIAITNISNEKKAKLFDLYQREGFKVKIYEDSLSGTSNASAHGTIREIKIEDLLFRDALSLNNSETKDFYANKTILVTGGGGSIGSELCRQVATLHPKKLIILDIYENSLYEIEQELIRLYGNTLNLEAVVASVRDVARLEEVFAKEKPEVVFHAAAHKHVPLMESSYTEAIKNNVIGTYNTANMAEKYGVQKFLLISTDKAVNPTNVMGASKRICEMIIQCRKDSKTEFCAVRFGNVLGSNGSVIPLFKKQIEDGGPVTITDKRIVRYFMTIPEAVGLVMEAGAMARGGELYVLDMGNPVKIITLAETMIKLLGYKPYKDIDIVEIGLRPGEKLYEELLMKTETLDKTSNKLIFIEKDKYHTREEIEEKLNLLRAAVEEGGYENMISAIRKTVPTYHSPEEINKTASEADEMLLASK